MMKIQQGVLQMSISRTFKSGLVLLALFAASGVFAASWFTNGPKRDVVTLVITGNYKSPRVMAELILYESRQPYLLLPTPESKDQRIIYVQAKGPAYEIPEKSLPQFVQFLNPHRIVILGDDRYVPAKYAQMLDRNIPVVRIEGNDWNRVAEQTTLLLGLSNLAGDYSRLRDQVDKRLRPTERVHREAAELKPVTDAPAAAEDTAATKNGVEVVELPSTATETAPAQPAK